MFNLSWPQGVPEGPGHFIQRNIQNALKRSQDKGSCPGDGATQCTLVPMLPSLGVPSPEDLVDLCHKEVNLFPELLRA